MLSKPFLSSIKLAHISLAFVGLMWVLPFLYYHHAYPITTFYQEWGTALLGICALPLLLSARFWEEPEVPQVVIVPIGLMFVLLVQFAVGRITHFDHMVLLAMYFLFAALLIILGRQLRVDLGLPVVATTLAVFLLIGAELNSLSGILQHYRWDTFLNSVVTAKTSNAVYGNTAQPNHFANYVALGLISLGLLHLKLAMRGWHTAVLALPLLFVMTLSGSRSSWLYLLFAAALAFVWQRRDKSMTQLLYYCLMLVLGFGAMHLIAQMPWFAGASGSVTTTERLFGDHANGMLRVHLWKEAGLIFCQFPMLGSGFGQFAFQHLHLAVNLHNPDINGLYNNAHNLVMQMAAEGGGAGLAFLLVGLGLWFRGTFRQSAQFTIYHWWGYAILAVLGIHSMLEYPLWYLYFIGIAALLLGTFDTKAYSLKLRRLGRVSVAVIMVLGMISLMQAMQGYRHLESALVFRGLASKDRSYARHAQEELLAAHSYSLLSSYAELFLANMMEPNEDHLREKMELNERTLNFIPVAPVVYRQALYLALAGKPGESREQFERALWAYPYEYQNARLELEELARKDPARFSALLEFATRKYEEYRSVAVPAK